MKPAIALLILGLAVASPLAGAQDLASLEQLRVAAEQGNADAQIEMGILYEFGYNMPKNHVTALAWYLRAAEHGDALAARRRDQIMSGMSPEEIGAAQNLAREFAASAPAAPANPPPSPEPSSTP